MISLLSQLSVTSFRTLVTWLKVLLRRTSGRLKACLRLALILLSTRSSIIESNKGQTGTLASSQALPSNVIETNQVPTTNVNEPENLAIPPLTNQKPSIEPPDTTQSAQLQGGNHLPGTVTPTVIKRRPILASSIQFERYERNLKVADLTTQHSFPAPSGVLDFSEKIRDDGWEPLVHPEGALFFYQARKRIITEADIRLPGIAKKIEQASDLVYGLAKCSGIVLPKTAELVLRLEVDVDDTCGYYFVDHNSKSLFWAEQHKLLLPELFGPVPATEYSHIRYAYEKQYWIHCDLFPNKRIVRMDIVDRLKCIITHAYAETVTSETSIAPYNVDDLNALMTLIGPLNDSTGKAHEHSICIISRLMQTFTQTQFLNFCGQPAARLDVDKSLYSQSERVLKWRAFLSSTLNVALFGSMQSHKTSIERVWVDNTVVEPRWKKFIAALSTEWNNLTVFSTVMLAVDVSFLAVPGVNSNSVQSQSASQITAYLSTLCAMGSLVVSLVLASEIQGTHRGTVEVAGILFWGMSNSVLGLDGLALIHSLPFALLIWAMVFFAAAMSIIIFHSTDAVALGVVAPVWAIIMLLIVWPVLAINNFHMSNWQNPLARVFCAGRSNSQAQV